MTTQTYYVSKLAGPRVAGARRTKGEAVALTEPQARAELLSGALVTETARIDDPWGEDAAAAARRDAAAKAAAEAQAAADRAKADPGVEGEPPHEGAAGDAPDAPEPPAA